ncbi:LysR family transcriptional regulator [Methylobacterium trifolii]|uniref:PCP degradation transcriptional activation protein n=1 Tax=Methylobacterium trifolii TaxID=1003092 RepID=A0ABQ4U3L0_9HYPH|nr:LysR family transcriptional regulator [Methylobacterium trifolii]GJE62053.1 PCP degradation transcriptional activation protein [Methylobacterium trifolii]
MTIKHHELAGVDLNLLVALDALLTERSVTRAAGHVGIGQSAMSSSLARLRKLLGDELLTRAPEGMHLTPRAMALVEPVRAVLRQFQGIVLREDTFDPATMEHTFTIALPGSVESYLVPRLLALLQREAPGVRLTLRALDYGTVQNELDADLIDFGIGVITEGQAHHKLRALYRFGYLCLFNADLLSVPAPLSLDDYLRFPHIMTSMTGTDRGLVDVALAAIGRRRRLAATTPRFTTVAFHVQAAPVIATMIDELAKSFATQLGLTTSPVPVPLDEFTYSMIWHASYDNDPAHRWLRGVLVRLGREAMGENADAAP